MSFSYDPSTPIGLVRLQIADTLTPGNTFADEEISAFLGLTGNNATRAAARALRSIASNKALLANHLKVLDIDVDNTDAAKSLIALAKEMEASDDESGAFAIAEMDLGIFSRRELIFKSRLRYGFR